MPNVGSEEARLVEGAGAAERGCGSPLFDRLLEVLHALICGQWASWLRGSKVWRMTPLSLTGMEFASAPLSLSLPVNHLS